MENLINDMTNNLLAIVASLLNIVATTLSLVVLAKQASIKKKPSINRKTIKVVNRKAIKKVFYPSTLVVRYIQKKLKKIHLCIKESLERSLFKKNLKLANC